MQRGDGEYAKRSCFIFDSLAGNSLAVALFHNMVEDVTEMLAAGVELHIIIPDAVSMSLQLAPAFRESCHVHTVASAVEHMPFEQYCCGVLEIVKELEPRYIFSVSSLTGRAITSWLSVHVQAGVVADAVGLELEEHTGHIRYTRSTDDDSLLSVISFDAFPEMATLRPQRAERVQPPLLPSGISVHEQPAAAHERTWVISRRLIEKSAYTNKVIIGVGRGVSPRALERISAFCARLNIPLMCTKPLVESGLFAVDRQIGQSGSSIYADLYIAVGISGALQHLIGTLHCRKMIAVNPDPNARIHQYSDVSMMKDAELVFSSLLQMTDEEQRVEGGVPL